MKMWNFAKISLDRVKLNPPTHKPTKFLNRPIRKSCEDTRELTFAFGDRES